MTTAAESHDAQLAAIKARHAQVARQFSDPAVTVIEDGITDMAMVHQIGLMSVYLDPIGRFWTITIGGEPRRITARMVFDPKSASAVWEPDLSAAEDEAYVREPDMAQEN